MDDPERTTRDHRAMRGVKTVEHIADYGGGDRKRHGAASPEESSERHALDVLGDQQDLAIDVEKVEDGNHVGLMDLRRNMSFEEEQLASNRIRDELFPQSLGNDGASKPFRTESAGEVERARAPCRDRGAQYI